MNTRTTAAAEFERHRTHLTGVAYRMLGTLADAEDAVQETYLRFARANEASLRDVRAWLTTAAGTGTPLVLLHGLGSSRRAWDPVIPALARHFDVLAVDLPGFGGSAPMPPEAEPLPAALAAAVAGLLDDLGIAAPHIAGNSLGGWVALELASIRPAASLTLLSPAPR